MLLFQHVCQLHRLQGVLLKSPYLYTCMNVYTHDHPSAGSSWSGSSFRQGLQTGLRPQELRHYLGFEAPGVGPKQKQLDRGLKWLAANTSPRSPKNSNPYLRPSDEAVAQSQLLGSIPAPTLPWVKKHTSARQVKLDSGICCLQYGFLSSSPFFFSSAIAVIIVFGLIITYRTL